MPVAILAQLKQGGSVDGAWHVFDEITASNDVVLLVAAHQHGQIVNLELAPHRPAICHLRLAIWPMKHEPADRPRSIDEAVPAWLSLHFRHRSWLGSRQRHRLHEEHPLQRARQRGCW